LPVALRIGDWDAVLAMLDQAQLAEGDKATNLRFLQSELRNFASGMQAIEVGNVVIAQAASAEMDAGLWRQGQDVDPMADLKARMDKAMAAVGKAKPGDAKDIANVVAKVTDPVNPDAMSGPLVSTLSVASMELRAGVLLLKGDPPGSKKLFDQAILAEQKLGYHEPPFYIRPVAEAEAEALLRAQDYAGAKAAFEKALIERPASGFELYGIARADELAGNIALAQAEYRAFLKAWPSADATLPQILDARKALGESTALATR
jgi:hypothetical protein